MRTIIIISLIELIPIPNRDLSHRIMLISHTLPASHSLPSRLPGIAVAIGLHAAVLAALLSYAPARQALIDFAPIMVSMMQPESVVPPQKLAKPKPVVRQAVKQPDPRPQPLLAISEPVSTPTPIVAPLPTPQLVEAVAVQPQPPAPVTPPQFNADLNNPAPPYPPLSRRLGEEGRVMLRVFVDERGLPLRVEMRSSSGHDRLDHVALETVKQWKFVPARRGDQAVSAWVLVPISFSLRR